MRLTSPPRKLFCFRTRKHFEMERRKKCLMTNPTTCWNASPGPTVGSAGIALATETPFYHHNSRKIGAITTKIRWLDFATGPRCEAITPGIVQVVQEFDNGGFVQVGLVSFFQETFERKLIVRETVGKYEASALIYAHSGCCPRSISDCREAE